MNILEDLLRDDTSFHVWQAVWLSEQITSKDFPNRKDYLFDQAGLRFRPYENYEYPPKDIRSIKNDNGEINFVLNFLGLYGINSPLPRCYHEQVSIQRRVLGEGNVPLQDFYDIFNNRFYWLYYLSWKKYRFYLFLNNKDNVVTQRLFSFIGKGIHSNHLPSVIPGYALLKFSGTLVQRTRNKTCLSILLAYIFPQFKMEIKEFIPHWADISDIPEIGKGNNILGINSFIGRKVLDYMSRICIEIGDISFKEYLNFLPGTANAKKLIELLNLYLNDGLQFDIKFIVQTSEISSPHLGDNIHNLGITAWLGKPGKTNIEILLCYEEYTSNWKHDIDSYFGVPVEGNRKFPLLNKERIRER